MSDTFYNSPQTERTFPTQEAEHAPFYVVSRGKFLTLFILTFSLYQLYWAYKNWKQFKLSSGEDLWPVARAIFAIFFTHALYREADARLKRDGRSIQWPHRRLATLFVVMLIISNIIDSLVRKNIGYPVLDAVSLAMLPVMGWITWLGQQGLNAAAGDPQGHSNARFTALNYVFIVLGAALLALACFGLTLPPQ
ncbi:MULTISPECIES: hypothetical protein [unclassified Pseudomonas]|uniref:hypothetical protein n=1 Tax=unclassified Pseudomonas TaxID=196821 RepID=UPI00209766D9|nr:MULTISPECIES: hypothetical protein [unclassified Pseudomonas]MCO7521906.1 hypothetical protein [Pseudomonas sp. 1]MCO7542390.1 hypothetical protein [Pseudomonas sp. VA159-2]